MGYEGRPDPDEYATHYAGYVGRVPAGDLVGILRAQIGPTIGLLRTFEGEAADRGYAPGKWTVKETVGHVIDVERVMSYRALRIARNDATPLPPFDENAWTPEGCFGERTLESLIAELSAVRASTVALFAGLPAEAWARTGTFSGNRGSVRAIACIIAGHELHHDELLRDRYCVLLVGG